jgi:hypothetical protein
MANGLWFENWELLLACYFDVVDYLLVFSLVKSFPYQTYSAAHCQMDYSKRSASCTLRKRVAQFFFGFLLFEMDMRARTVGADTPVSLKQNKRLIT